MNNRIEKFLIWACVLRILGLSSFYLSTIVWNWMAEAGMSSSYLSLIPSIVGFLLLLPLRFVCGAWLKGEAERINRSPWVWFWTGFVFELIGVIAFYAYMIYRKSLMKPQSNQDEQ